LRDLTEIRSASKAASLALPRPCDPLLNEAAAEIGVDQTTPRSFDRRHEAIIANGFAFS